MPSSKRRDRLGDVVANCERIARHVAGMSRDAFFADEKTIDAVERCLQRISEAASKLGRTDKMLRYAVKLTRDDNGTMLVTAPDLPEVSSFGEDATDALVRAADAIATALGALPPVRKFPLHRHPAGANGSSRCRPSSPQSWNFIAP